LSNVIISKFNILDWERWRRLEEIIT